MFAIVTIAGQQFKVTEGQRLFVHQLDAEAGSKITFDQVHLIAPESGEPTIGAPTVKGASISATVEDHVRGDKVIIFKKKRRKGYRRKNGHRQSFSRITINSIAS
ncbi:MAG: 50S ribosomal protein L21 [Saprospiraceae bacterium]